MATATAKIAVTAEDRTKKAFQNVQNSLKNLDKSFGQLKAGIGALVGIGGVGAFATQMVQTADKIGKVSAKLGISTDALQKFRFGAEQSGVATSTFDMAIQRMTRRVAEAREGTGEAKKALEEMGISLRDSSGQAKTTEQIFLEVADVMKGMTSQSDKVRLSFKLFDSEGVSLVNMMQQGSTAIKDYGEQLEAYGGIIDQKAIKATEDFNDALNILQKQGRGIFSAIVLGAKDFIEALEDIGLKTKEVFDVSGKMKEGLNPQDLVREYERLEKEIENLNLDLATYTDGWSFYNLLLKDQSEIDKEISKIQNKITEALLKQYTIEESTQHINVKQVENKEAELDALKKTSKLVVHNLSKSKAKQKLDRASMLFTQMTLELDKKTYRVTLKDLQGKGQVLGVVKGLTKEQAEQLVSARKNAREQLAYEGAVKASENASKKLTNELKKQKKAIKDSREIAFDFASAVKGSSAEATRFFNAFKLDLIETKKGLELAFDTNWVGILARFAFSSKVFTQTVGQLFGAVGGAVDTLLGGLVDVEDESGDLVKKAKEIALETESLTGSIDNYVISIKNSSTEMQTLATIEKDYQGRVKRAQELEANHLLYIAQVEKDMATLAYRVGVLRSATTAFASSAQQFLDAVATEGFSDVQKRFFAMAKGFDRGTKASFLDVIEESQKIIDSTPANPSVMKTAWEEILASLKKGSKDLYSLDYETESIGKILEKYGMKSEDVAPLKEMFVELKKSIQIPTQHGYRKRFIEDTMAKYIPTLTLGITGLEAKIDAFDKAVLAIANAEEMIPEALKGLVIMIKDVMQTEFDAGATKEQLKLDVDALSETFKGLGIDVKSLTDFIDTLIKINPEGAMGGLVKRYPYGGSIHGPSHAGGGVKTELEGGEYVMRKSAVSQYGQDFMNQINSGRFSMGQPIQVSIYDGTGQAIDEYDSAIRVEINQRANRFNQFPSLAN